MDLFVFLSPWFAPGNNSKTLYPKLHDHVCQAFDDDPKDLVQLIKKRSLLKHGFLEFFNKKSFLHQMTSHFCILQGRKRFLSWLSTIAPSLVEIQRVFWIYSFQKNVHYSIIKEFCFILYLNIYTLKHKIHSSQGYIYFIYRGIKKFINIQK